MDISTNGIEKLALGYLTQEIAGCPRLNPVFNADDKILSWDGEIQLYKNSNHSKENFMGRCAVQIKGHTVESEDIRKHSLSYQVDINDLKVYQKDGGVLYFVICISEKNGINVFKAFYCWLLPYDLGNILSSVKEDQKTKSLHLLPFPKNNLEKERIISQFIRDKGLQFNAAYEYPMRIEDFAGRNISYVFWGSTDFSFIGSNRPVYLYGRINNKPYTHYPLGKWFVSGVVAHNIPVKVMLDDEVYFDNAHIELKKKGKIGAVILNSGLSIVFKQNNIAKIKLSEKCSIDEYIRNLEFILQMSRGKHLSIEGLGDGDNFQFDRSVDSISEQISYMDKISQLFKKLHVVKEVKVRDISSKTLSDLHYLYRAIVNEEHFDSKEDSEPVIGIYSVGQFKFLLMRFVGVDGKIVYRDGFDGSGIHCEMSDMNGNKYESSIYVRMKKDYFLMFDNINYEEIVRSVTEVKYSSFYGQLVNLMILEMLAAYDEQENDVLLESTIKISKWLYLHDESVVNFLNYVQAVKRQRSFTDDELVGIRDYRDGVKDSFTLAGFAAVLGNMDDYLYYLSKLSDEDKNRFLMYPICRVI